MKMTRFGVSRVCTMAVVLGGMAAAAAAEPGKKAEKPVAAPAHPTSFETLLGHVDIGGDQKHVVVTFTEADGAVGRIIQVRRPGQPAAAYDPDAMTVLFLLGGEAHRQRPLFEP